MAFKDSTDEKFSNQIGGSKLSLIQFSASWCGPCQQLKPIIEKISNDMLKMIDKRAFDLAATVGSSQKIYLNDKDFELLNKFIENNKLEITFKLELDPSLGRGDFTIDMGGVIQAIKYKKVIE